MRCGEVTTSDGKRMVESLLALKGCLEAPEIEKRVRNLEDAVFGKSPPATLLKFPDQDEDE
jgi:hypothetical protein